MPTQKIFKQRVRARMDKTGESYTTARRHMLAKASDPAAAPETAVPTPILADAQGVSDEAMVRATGRTHVEWFAILDAWGATAHSHTEIARWLSDDQGVPGWWTQSVTVAYERARGMRARHQMRDGFSISVTKTIGVGADRALAAFTDASLRGRWLSGDPMSPRPTRAKLTARFDWAEPASRVVVTIAAKGPEKSVIAVSHEKLPDPESAERLKASWRDWLKGLERAVGSD